MNVANIEFDFNEDNMFTCAISDEALEAAACVGSENAGRPHDCHVHGTGGVPLLNSHDRCADARGPE